MESTRFRCTRSLVPSTEHFCISSRISLYGLQKRKLLCKGCVTICPDHHEIIHRYNHHGKTCSHADVSLHLCTGVTQQPRLAGGAPNTRNARRSQSGTSPDRSHWARAVIEAMVEEEDDEQTKHTPFQVAESRKRWERARGGTAPGKVSLK